MSVLLSSCDFLACKLLYYVSSVLSQHRIAVGVLGFKCLSLVPPLQNPQHIVAYCPIGPKPHMKRWK